MTANGNVDLGNARDLEMADGEAKQASENAEDAKQAEKRAGEEAILAIEEMTNAEKRAREALEAANKAKDEHILYYRHWSFFGTHNLELLQASQAETEANQAWVEAKNEAKQAKVKRSMDLVALEKAKDRATRACEELVNAQKRAEKRTRAYGELVNAQCHIKCCMCARSFFGYTYRFPLKDDAPTPDKTTLLFMYQAFLLTAGTVVAAEKNIINYTLIALQSLSLTSYCAISLVLRWTTIYQATDSRLVEEQLQHDNGIWMFISLYSKKQWSGKWSGKLNNQRPTFRMPDYYALALATLEGVIFFVIVAWADDEGSIRIFTTVVGSLYAGLFGLLIVSGIVTTSINRRTKGVCTKEAGAACFGSILVGIIVAGSFAFSVLCAVEIPFDDPPEEPNGTTTPPEEPIGTTTPSEEPIGTTTAAPVLSPGETNLTLAVNLLNDVVNMLKALQT